MKDCIFCKIVQGKAEAAKIWEDDEFVAFLDLYPCTKGMALVVPKKHYHSYAFDMPDDVYARLMLATKRVALLLDRKLPVKRSAMVMEGMAIDHVHINVYPMHGLSVKFKQVLADERIFFEKYEGYISTQLGLKADMKELKRLAAKIAG